MYNVCMKREDLTGKIFGRLTIDSFSHSGGVDGKPRRTMWNVTCECGTKKVVSAANLKHRGVYSCGCARQDGLNKKTQGLASFNSKFASYRNGAKKRNLSFSLSKDEFRELVLQPCHYCGVEGSSTHQANNCNGAFISNGIDRKESAKGYELENCLPCCGTCNIMKMGMGYDEFIEHMLKILKFLRKV